MDNIETAYKYMNLAIEEARLAAESNEKDVPVGCIIVDKEGNIIGKGRNTRCLGGSVLGHAEINAMEEARKNTGSYLLDDTIMFVTLEPCPMCAGAIAASRIPQLFYGADNTENGACGSVYNLLYPHTEVFGGIKAEECSSLLKDFFKNLRKKTEQ